MGEDRRMKKCTLPELPYDYAALEPHYSARLLELHHGRHHAACVTGANETMEKLAAARERHDVRAVDQLEKSLAFYVSGHVLHSLFWHNLSPHGGGQPTGEFARAVRESFGSFDAVKVGLTEAALNVQGSGWGALAWNPVAQRLVVEQVYEHQGDIGNGTVLLLVLDMWEHAYYPQYQDVRGDWVAAFWKVVNWEDVAERYALWKSVAGLTGDRQCVPADQPSPAVSRTSAPGATDAPLPESAGSVAQHP